MSGAKDHAGLSAEFAALHRGRILVLANAWDAASARVFEAAGFPALGTTSAGIAYSLGYPDGERVPFALMRQAIERIVRSVAVPVTADLERGRGRSPEEVAARCLDILEAGAVGVNLEDGTGEREQPLVDPELHAERIGAAKEAAARKGLRLFVNARTDVSVDAGDPGGKSFAEAVSRARRYRAAGADGIFLPHVRDGETIRRLVAAIDGPVNVLAGPGVPAIPRLAELGVARVSVGSGPMRATLGLLRRIARELRGDGSYGELTAGAVPYPEANALFESRER